MNGKKIGLILAGCVLAVGVLTAASQGSVDDPLVTLSYLEKVLTPQLETKVDEAVKTNEEELKKQLDIAVTSYETRVDETLSAAGSASFVSKELGRGDKLTLPAGRELLLVEGEAAAVGTLSDTTAGETVKEGEGLTAGHLYVTVTENAGVKAASAAKVMSR